MVSRNSTRITLNEETCVDFLFDISKEVKHFYETPAIFITKKDYSDDVLNILCSMRTALLAEEKNDIINLIVDAHMHWLQAINEVENLKKRIDDLARDEIYEAISYTKEAMVSRMKYFKRYMQKNQPSLSNDNQAFLIADVEIVEEMHTDVIKCLSNKLKCFRNFDSDDIFKIKVKDAVDELLNWIDMIYDKLAILLSKYINVNIPHITGDLTKTLQQIVDSFKNSNSESSQQLLNELKTKGKEISTMIRCIAGHNLEISKVVEKINILEERIARLELEPTSAALMALKNKKEYLEKRLTSLENLKTTLKNIHQTTEVALEEVCEEEICSCEDFYQLRVFNHMLPQVEREHLVTELCHLWDMAVFGERGHKSVISILSVADVKEEFTDELGTFYIDEYSRKIYRIPDDDTLYQVNEQSRLVPLTDDGDHVYYYDECGRYFVDPKNRQRVYKANATASEYMMDSSGVLLKVKEVRDGVTYYYDNYGRYYINEEGKHIYRDQDTVSEYENDGLGNLVRIRSHMDIFDVCPDDINVTEDFKYLKLSVGKALRECIADVILHQPPDPIKYLSARLVKYRESMESREKEAQEKEELIIERQIKMAEERAEAERLALQAAQEAQGGSEASYDSNIMKYTSLQPDDEASAGASTAY